MSLSVNTNYLTNTKINLTNAKLPENNSQAFNAENIKTEITKEQPKQLIKIRTVLNQAEQFKYKAVLNIISKDARKNLDKLLKNGVLLNDNSQNNETTLDNLYKILTNQRAEGLMPEVLIQETLNILCNPFKSTQTFGDIPKEYQNKAIAKIQKDKTNLIDKNAALKEINVEHSGSCPAASIEFSLASKKPAEFTRFVEGLSSPQLCVEKNIHLNNLADNTMDAVWLLSAFKIPYEMKDFNIAKLKFAPDENALIRAQIQTKHKDKQERSVIDVLMQSTFMQIGSQQTYNSLSDKRAVTFSPNTTGLIEFEKTFTESVVKDKNKITLTNQILDDEGKLIGYEADFKSFSDKIIKTLNQDEDLIIGYTHTDENKKVVNGHEITIVGARKDEKTGKTMFICNDSDDDYYGAVEYSEDYLLPKIHHATFPKEIVEAELNTKDNWVTGIETYKKMKKSV